MKIETLHLIYGADTSPQAARIQREIQLRMSYEQRGRLLLSQIELTRELVLAGLRQRYPDESPARIFRRFSDLWLGRELAATVYGPAEYERG